MYEAAIMAPTWRPGCFLFSVAISGLENTRIPETKSLAPENSPF